MAQNGTNTSITPSIQDSLLILTASELSTSPHFPAVCALEKAAFSDVHTNSVPGKEFLPASMGRFSQPQDMIDEIGPTGFCMLTFQGEELVGVICAKPYSDDHDDDPNLVNHARADFKRQKSTDKVGLGHEGVGPTWELLANAVALDKQRQGIATRLIDSCVEEIKRRVRAEGPQKLVIFISILQEATEGFYLRRGYRTTNVMWFPPGTRGSRDGFHVGEMFKIFDV